jgi:uncharacterized protein YjbJ (UPF0337 family)
MSRDRIQGKVKQGKGKAKQEVGKLLGDRSTEWSGVVDQVEGNVQEKIGEVKDTRRFADGRVR